MPLVFGGAGVSAGLNGQATNTISLAAGATKKIPAGGWSIRCGLYCNIQQLDPVTGIWRPIGAGPNAWSLISSDGTNFRVANQTGCAVGAVVTTAGSAYTTPPTVTPSGGASVWQAIVGGAIGTTVSILNGGSNYTYPPTLAFDAPPLGNGVPATAHCALTSGAVSSITVDDQGAGYLTPPNVYFVPDVRDTTGSGASGTTTLTGAGTVTALLVLDHGTAVTTLPTLTFSPASTTAATVIMCWTVTAYTVATVGSGYGAPVMVTSLGTGFSGTSVLASPNITSQLVKWRRAELLGAVSGTGITATGQAVYDGGIFSGVPVLIALPGPFGAAATSQAGLVATVGGVTDSYEIMAV